MFSYRHGFHAGNHADVLKHIVMTQVLSYFRLKETPFWGIDTHAGAGLYDLHGDWANKRSEYKEGIGRIWSLLHPETDLPQKQMPPEAFKLLKPWLAVIHDLNPDGQLKYYPGSPWLWLKDLRTQDRLKLIEKLPAEAEILKKNLSQAQDVPTRCIQVIAADGFGSLKALLPPPVKRAFILMDPSYEDKQDYQRVINSVKEALQRFSTACIMIWYPRVSRLQVEQMRKQLRKLAPSSWLDVSMAISRPPSDGHGLFGSGCFLINPPYVLAGMLRSAMPWLTEILSQDGTAQWELLSGENTHGKGDDDEHPRKNPSHAVRPKAAVRTPMPGKPGSRPYKKPTR